MHVRPVDMPRVRQDLLVDAARLDSRGGMILGCYGHDLPGADLFHVSEPMTALAAQAAASMPDYVLQREDVPSRSGLMYFAVPLGVIQYESGSSAAICGAAWFAHSFNGEPGVSMGLLAGREESILANAARMTPEIERRFRSQWADLHPTAAHFAGFGHPLAARPRQISENIGGDAWDLVLPMLKKVITAWNLMSQTLAGCGQVHYDRATRRRLIRDGLAPDPVRVITLRRPAGSGSGQSDREYHHRWIVRGHWRQQWYPSRGVNRPVWIAPHIKGPEDAPLLGGEKVYALKR